MYIYIHKSSFPSGKPLSVMKGALKQTQKRSLRNLTPNKRPKTPLTFASDTKNPTNGSEKSDDMNIDNNERNVDNNESEDNIPAMLPNIPKSPIVPISNKLLSNRDLLSVLDYKINEIGNNTEANTLKLLNPQQGFSFDSYAVRVFYSPKDIKNLKLVILDREIDKV
jgi:hypothetical protein